MSKADLYSVLGVERGADEPTIRRAYRRAAKHAHPDGGGSPEAFGRLSRALRVLTNAKARDHYDKTGEVDEPGPDQTQSQIHMMAANALLQAMASSYDVDRTDLIAAAKANLRQLQTQCRAANNQVKEGIDRLERVAKRLKRKKSRVKTPDFMQAMIEGHIAMLRRSIAMNDAQMEQSAEAMKLIDEYTYDTEPLKPFGFFPSTTSTNQW